MNDLRRAAAAIRRDMTPVVDKPKFKQVMEAHLAVAAWLDDVGERFDDGGLSTVGVRQLRHAFAVARTYLDVPLNRPFLQSEAEQ